MVPKHFHLTANNCWLFFINARFNNKYIWPGVFAAYLYMITINWCAKEKMLENINLWIYIEDLRGPTFVEPARPCPQFFNERNQTRLDEVYNTIKKSLSRSIIFFLKPNLAQTDNYFYKGWLKPVKKYHKKSRRGPSIPTKLGLTHCFFFLQLNFKVVSNGGCSKRRDWNPVIHKKNVVG